MSQQTPGDTTKIIPPPRRGPRYVDLLLAAIVGSLATVLVIALLFLGNQRIGILPSSTSSPSVSPSLSPSTSPSVSISIRISTPAPSTEAPSSPPPATTAPPTPVPLTPVPTQTQRNTPPATKTP